MNHKNFLIEIYTEEIPSNNIRKIAKKFYENFQIELKKNNIIFSKITLFDSPKRIALQIQKISNFAIVKKKTNRGPSIQYAYNHGKLTNIALKWLKKFNINIQDTKIFKNEKGQWLSYEHHEKKILINNIIPEIIVTAIKNISLKKTMKWNQYNIKFIRPIRNIMILLDNIFIPFQKLGIPSKKYLCGNISTIPKKIKITHAKDYENILYKFGNVIAKFNIRKKKIQYQCQKIAHQLNGKIHLNNFFLEEISCLIEWPMILYGKFQRKFLSIPKNILVYIIQNIQKNLPIYHIDNNKLTENFIIISNNNNTKYNHQIISGNENILHAKLSDIKFFMKNDQKIKFKKYIFLLKKIIFHEKLGNMFQKTKRLMKLMQHIIIYTKENFKDSIQCVLLSKCDLMTNMVYEFPKLKGTIGMYYALNNGISKNIALAIQEQYKPKFSKDELPANNLGCLLSIIDKIDTLIGFFLIGKNPQNDQDPFCLRRLAIGIIRIIIEKKININLEKIIIQSIKLHQIKHKKEIYQKIIQFIINRLHILYQEKKYQTNIITAVLNIYHNNLLNIDNKIKILSSLKKNNFLKILCTTYKRISKLLKKTNIDINQNIKINNILIQNQSEKNLYIMIKNTSDIIKILLKKKQYEKLLKILLNFNIPVEQFLNTISIKDSENNIKINRILMLQKIKNFFLKIADFEKI